jgi:hypothetical protein
MADIVRVVGRAWPREPVEDAPTEARGNRPKRASVG